MFCIRIYTEEGTLSVLESSTSSIIDNNNNNGSCDVMVLISAVGLELPPLSDAAGASLITENNHSPKRREKQWNIFLNIT